MPRLPSKPLVSVVLCTYAPEMYDHFLEAARSVLAQSYDRVELVVVVDGSENVHDRARADLGDHDSVVVHRNESNVGLLRSRNTGAELANGEVVAFIDDDALADDDWVAALVRAYEHHDAVAVGGRMTPEWVDGEPDFLPEEFFWLVGVTHRGFADGPGEVRNTFGSNISFQASVFEQLGGFDPDVGGRHGEKNLQGGETELCARLQTEYGQGVYYTPDAIMAHKVFDYRTDPRWLLDRAFWQGYSKRAMATLVPGSAGVETSFLGQLLTEFIPARIGRLLRAPSRRNVSQFVSLLGLTVVVGLGYLYGLTRYPPW